MATIVIYKIDPDIDMLHFMYLQTLAGGAHPILQINLNSQLWGKWSVFHVFVVGYIPSPEPLEIQWQSSDNPMCQCVSSVLPVVFQCVPIMQINTGLSLGHHCVLTSANVVPVASQCIWGSSDLLVSSNYANDELWITAGRPLGNRIGQCGSSVVCPVVSQCTGSIWFGGH